MSGISIEREDRLDSLEKIGESLTNLFVSSLELKERERRNGVARKSKMPAIKRKRMSSIVENPRVYFMVYILEHQCNFWR